MLAAEIRCRYGKSVWLRNVRAPTEHPTSRSAGEPVAEILGMGLYVRLGYRDWQSVKSYLGGKRVLPADMPEPDWLKLMKETE